MSRSQKRLVLLFLGDFSAYNVCKLLLYTSLQTLRANTLVWCRCCIYLYYPVLSINTVNGVQIAICRATGELGHLHFKPFP